MKWLRVTCCVVAIFLAGCATLSERDRLVLEQHRVSDAVYDKMVHREPLDVPDIIELSKRNVPTPFILRYIRSSSAIYRLNSSEVTRMRRAGVNAQIVDYMLETPRLEWARYGPYWDPWGPYYYPYDPWYYGYGPYIGVRPFYHHWHHWH
jgi:hypothetical protein